MMNVVITIALKDSILLNLDKIRGDIPRSRFISRLLERIIPIYKENKVQNIPELEFESNFLSNLKEYGND